MKDLIPLFSTMAGAAIALITMLVQYKITVSKDRKALLRNRLDEMGMIAGEIVFWVNQDLNSMHAIAVGGKLDDSVPRREYLQRLKNLNRITKLYHRQLVQETDKFIAAVKEYDQVKISFTVQTVKDTHFDFQSYKEKVHPKFEKLNRAETQFVDAISKTIANIL